MRTILTLTFITSLLYFTGCGCAAYSGGGDKVYARNADSLVLCDNGGFVANVPTGSIEGKYIANAPGTAAAGFGVRGDDGQLAFDFYAKPDGSATTPQLGETPWKLANLDQWGLDHADVQCQDLVTRAWWNRM
jgi:hypothetical protein